jgi:catechol 2,3-dioxygenase-like lactoylglutathione lyase family enzyme
MRAANKCGVQGPRQRNIGTELRAPVEKALILETGQTGTDAELAHLAAPAAPRTVLPMIIFRAISRMRLDFAFKLDYRLCLTGQQCSRWESCDGTAAPLCCLRRRPGAIRKALSEVFDLEQVGREDLDIGSAIYMSDGVINLALLNFSGRRGNDIKGDPTKAIGANHFGFQVDDLAETQRRIESAGGTFFFDLGDERHGNFERKFKDPDGVVFDISQNGWVGTDGQR